MHRRFAWSDILRFEIVTQMRLGSRAIAWNLTILYVTSELRRVRCNAVPHEVAFYVSKMFPTRCIEREPLRAISTNCMFLLRWAESDAAPFGMNLHIIFKNVLQMMLATRALATTFNTLYVSSELTSGIQRRSAWSPILCFQIINQMRLATWALTVNFKTLYVTSELTRERGTAVPHELV